MARDTSKHYPENEIRNDVYDRDGKFLYTYDMTSDIAFGDVSDRGSTFKYGHNVDVDQAFETIWSGGGVYADMAAASKLKISSGSTDDVMTTGTGAWTVQVYGLDANYAQINDTVELNGRTAVETDNLYLFVYRMIVRSAGSGGTAVGIIYAGTGTVTTGVPANIYAMIDIGYNQTMMARYVTAANEQAIIHSWFMSVIGKKQVEARLVFTPFGEVPQVKDEIFITADGGSIDKHFHIPRYIAPKTIIEVQGKGALDDNIIVADFELECRDV